MLSVKHIQLSEDCLQLLDLFVVVHLQGTLFYELLSWAISSAGSFFQPNIYEQLSLDYLIV